MSKGRVEAFSDGVFAVAATLLIFNITIDRLPDITHQPPAGARPQP